tara:strand:- start:775 stop:1191 length:417 start_codon:yes stop_codon:yes gene_type:complete
MNKGNLLINKLKLKPHPEGGHFVETARDSKNSYSHIYYLLQKGETSHWHKLYKKEILLFYDGDPLQILLSKNKVHTKKITLGKNINKGHKYNFIIDAKTWFSMISLGNWSLIGCIVIPAFDYKDFVLAPPNWLPGGKN